jgi:hypothetical protein
MTSLNYALNNKFAKCHALFIVALNYAPNNKLSKCHALFIVTAVIVNRNHFKVP